MVSLLIAGETAPEGSRNPGWCMWIFILSRAYHVPYEETDDTTYTGAEPPILPAQS